MVAISRGVSESDTPWEISKSKHWLKWPHFQGPWIFLRCIPHESQPFYSWGSDGEPGKKNPEDHITSRPGTSLPPNPYLNRNWSTTFTLELQNQSRETMHHKLTCQNNYLTKTNCRIIVNSCFWQCKKQAFKGILRT